MQTSPPSAPAPAGPPAPGGPPPPAPGPGPRRRPPRRPAGSTPHLPPPFPSGRRRLLRRHLAGSLGGAAILILLLCGLAAPRLAPHDPYLVDLNRRLEGPSATFPLGTDQFGRCTLSRLLYGARSTLGTALVVLGATVAISGAVGAAASIGPPRARRAGAWVLDIGQSLPTMVVAVAVVGLLGPGLANAMVAVVATMWAPPARLLRALFLGESRAAHVDAARALGASPARVFGRHLLPGVVGRGAVVFATYLGQIVLTFSALSFLGLGPQPPAAEWGAMLNEGRPFFWTHPSLMVLPGVAVVVAVGACNLLADALRDAADDRRRD